MKTDILLTRLAIGVSTLAIGLGLFSLLSSVAAANDSLSFKKAILIVIFCLALLSLFYGNIVYQLTRLGQIRRRVAHSYNESEVDALGSMEHPPRLVILVPSYKEQLSVVMQTVLSAALAKYPNREVTLLLDDPPAKSGADLAALDATRRLILELDEFFKERANEFGAAAQAFERRMTCTEWRLEGEILAGLYDRAAAAVEELGHRYAECSGPAFAHADEVFTREVIQRLVGEHRDQAARFRNGPASNLAECRREFRRLTLSFAVPIGCFERKRFANLSHAANKAMNLNSYIGLMGRAFRISRPGGNNSLLVDCPAEEADLIVPAADYVLTIDADSIILPDYILKLVSVMQADTAIAIAQSPYSAYPGAPSVLERVAGATTDIQYLVHQGFTAFNATFWVGANAIIRYSALAEIKTVAEERGYPVPVFIQDKTLIEDTGSTIDLASCGWRLHNYPERLAYSATPADFGALVIQRRRWANGGLIIFPGLIELWSRSRGPRASGMETFIRSHYLLSPALANLGLLLLLLIPFGQEFSNVWFPIAAAPYYFLYGRDLTRLGYQWRDLLRVYALTLLLVPINLAGVFGSLQQSITGRKAAFARTPKVDGRTAAPASHILALSALFATAVLSAAANLYSGNLLFFTFSAVNAGFFLYGFTSLIGWREALADIRATFSPQLQQDHPLAIAKQFAEQPR